MTPAEAGCNCEACPYSTKGKPFGWVDAKGPARPHGVVITEAPSQRDSEDNEILGGPTGERFDEALEAAGLRRDQLLFVHVVMCKPKEPRRPKETKAALTACKPQLDKVLAVHGKLPTLVLGATAMAAVGKHGALTGRKSIRGFLDGNRIYTLHPTFAAFHEPYSWGAFVEDVKRFGRLIRGELEREPVIVWDATHHDIAALVRSASLRNKRISLDVETLPASKDAPWTGKDPTRARLKQVGLGVEDFGISVHMKHADGPTRDMLKLVLADPSITKIMHNGPWFDLRVLERHDYPVTNWEDTRDMRRACSSTSKLSLAFLGSLATDIHAWKVGDDKFDEDDISEEETEDGKEEETGEDRPRWDMGSDQSDGEYNALDCAVTSRVDRMCLEDLAAERSGGNPVDKLYEVHKRLSLLTAEMHTTGIYVHEGWRGFMKHCLEQSIEEKKQAVRAAVGQADFPLTPHGMRALIYKRHAKDGIKGFNLPDPYDKRMYTNPHLMETISVNENSLLMLLVSGIAPPELVPMLDAWWDLQGEIKRYGYVKSALFDQAIGPDGRVRPGWNSNGADTMRWSCSQPNVMNMEQLLRFMLAPAPGRCLIHADKTSLELNVMACVAEDNALAAALDSGNVYDFDARTWFSLPDGFSAKKEKPKVYKTCKIIHLGSQYGAGDKTVWQQGLRQDRNFTWAQVQVLGKQFKKLYRGTVEYWDAEMARVMACGYSEGRVIGGRRYYPMPPDRSETVNYPVQRSAAELMNLEVLELWDRLKAEVPTARIVIQLHDAVDVECRERDEEKVSRIMSEVMNREWKVGNRTRMFPVEMKTTRSSSGGTWYDV